MPPARRPNYALRRAVALALALGLVWLAFSAFSAVLGGDDDGGEVATRGTGTSTTTTTVPPPPTCTYGDIVTEASSVTDWQRSIVDTERRLPDDYVPTDLVPASEAGFSELYEVRGFLVEDLRRIREAAEANGTPIELLAGYRSIADQADLFGRREAEMGFERAAAKTARPGHSEHHLGTTVDFRTSGETDVDASWANDPAGAWVLAHAHEYGFVLSYAEGVRERTCYDFEPWHYRYFGTELAGRIHASGLTPREYLWRWQQTGVEPSPSRAAG